MTERTFEAVEAKIGKRPLLLGLVGASSSGKTYSALRLATGIQKVFGGDICYIDTESCRALHYADRFKFKHIDFKAPFGPLDYIEAIKHAVKISSKVIIIDSMTHEHSGEGGVMDQSEKLLDKWCGEDEGKRHRNQGRSFIVPKGQRRKLNNFIVQVGSEVVFIFCYRAKEGLDFKNKGADGQLREKGWEPETTSTLHFEMTQRFLLMPGCDGVPTLASEKLEEKRMIKNPVMFRDWLKQGAVLDEQMGERFGRWAMATTAAVQTPLVATSPAPSPAPVSAPATVQPPAQPEASKPAPSAPVAPPPAVSNAASLEAVGFLEKVEPMVKGDSKWWNATMEGKRYYTFSATNGKFLLDNAGTGPVRIQYIVNANGYNNITEVGFPKGA